MKATFNYQNFCRDRKTRLLSVACYFGFVTILWVAGGDRQKNRFVQHHFQHSLMLSLMLFLFIVTYALTGILIYVNNVYFWKPSQEEVRALGWLIQLSDYTNTAIALLGVAALGISAVSAWRGSTVRFPLLSKVAQHKGWMKFSLYWTIFLQLGFILVLLLAAHGSFLARNSSSPAHVYILYTQGGYIPLPQWYESYTPPRWTFSLFFYPIVLSANLRWGSGSVDIQPLSDISFREAIHNGRFVFVASHGGMEPGSFTSSYIPYKNFLPSEVMPGDTGSQLRYVYFAACDAGFLEEDWEKALSPAQVRTFDRISYVPEHFLWVWTEGAKVVRDIE
jgi:hypothetical protein